MKTKQLKLSQVKVNQSNPRSITERKLAKLIRSILIFPKMLEIRPIVINDQYVALGGNMRLRALTAISKMNEQEISEELAKCKDWANKTDAEKSALIEYWVQWSKDTKVSVCDASNLSAEERKHFIITDNASFGEWDYDKLANEWDADDLVEWGVDVWRPDPALPTSSSSGQGSPGIDPNTLPEELQGEDINPDDLPKITGDEETLMDRVIIVYPKDRVEEIANLLGLEKIDKVIYNITELLNTEA